MVYTVDEHSTQVPHGQRGESTAETFWRFLTHLYSSSHAAPSSSMPPSSPGGTRRRPDRPSYRETACGRGCDLGWSAARTGSPRARDAWRVLPEAGPCTGRGDPARAGTTRSPLVCAAV